MATKRILLVDDDPRIREFGEEVLTEYGYEVVTASNGREAQQHLQDQTFDAALVDLKMPDMNGADLLRWMRAEGYALPVWVMTGYGSLDSCLECARLGIQGYLSKPVSIKELTTILGEALKPTLEKDAAGSPAAPSAAPSEGRVRQPLTEREKEILGHMRYGLTDAEIARKLYLSEHTVHNHVKHIVEKLAVRNRVEAVSLSFKEDVF